ncbi:MAG: hypothetical protein WCD18_27650 [Thermosynechococcaceae cyanobacterium]
MSLPQKRRGFRRITVNGVIYDWCCGKVIDIRRSDKPRSSLFIDIVFNDPWLQKFETRLNNTSNPITPAFIAYAIQEVTQLGWQPTDYLSCIARYEGGRFTLEYSKS